MLTRNMVRFFGVALVGFVCVLATEASAQIVTAQTAPLSCSVPLGSGTLTVETVPGGAPLAFPHDVPCPGGGGTCSEYNYKFTSSIGSTLWKSFLSVSSDLAIFQTTPSAIIEDPSCKGDLGVPLIGRFVCEQRTISFGSQPNGFSASVIVTHSAPRVSTSGSFVNILNSGVCLIQGPGVPGGAFTPFTIKRTDTISGGKCTVDVAPDANNKVTRKEQITNPIGCDQFDLDLSVNGSPFRDSQDAPITAGTGTYTCYPTTPKASCYCVRGTVCP